MDLPRNFVAHGDRVTVHLQLASDTVCSITWTDASDGQKRRQVRFGTWSRRGNEVELVLDGAAARYEWSPGGTVVVDGRQCVVPQLVPRFAETIGALPATPLLSTSALQAASEPPAPQRVGPLQWFVGVVMRLASRLPWWMRAPVVTATMLVAIVLLRGLFAVRSAADLAGLGAVLGKVALAGLAAGAAPTLLWRPLLRLGYAGSLINGVIAMWSYMLVCNWAFMDPGQDLRSIFFFAYSGAFGLFIGHLALHPLATRERARRAER